MKRFCFVIACGFMMISSVALGATTELVSLATSGDHGYGWVNGVTINSDGTNVAFAANHSFETTDTNGLADIYIRNTASNTTQRVSIATDGTQGNGESLRPSISGDGNIVAFDSLANSLVPMDYNAQRDIFVHNIQTGETVRASVASDGSEGNHYSTTPVLSDNGRFVIFRAYASNLVPNDTNGNQDIFLRDLQLGTTERIDVATDGTESNQNSAFFDISADGRFVVFQSYASNLIPNDTNGVYDIFLRDRQLGTTERISNGISGAESNGHSSYPVISDDGRYIAYISQSTNLVPGDTNLYNDVFVYDQVLGTTERVNVSSTGEQSDLTCSYPSISGNGRFVAFRSNANTLLAGSNQYDQIYIADRVTGDLEFVSVDSNGAIGNAMTNYGYLDYTGRYVAMSSMAHFDGDTDNNSDIFLHDRINNIDGDAYFYLAGVDESDCDDLDPLSYPGATEITLDGIDQDCNGYDLTIEIQKANYIVKDDSLRVEATSALGSAANLTLENYGAMIWKENKQHWYLNVTPAGGNPGSVTVTGPEGSVAINVTVQ